jgi:mono/diheme cytochrome c family protein
VVLRWSALLASLRAGTLPPVATLFFVLVFVGLALTTLLFAMSRGRGGLGGMLHSQTRGGRRFATFLFVVALLGLGVAVPVWVITSVRDRNDAPAAQLSGLTAEQVHGQALFGRRCGLCHTLQAANAVARVGPNLDQLAPNEKLVLDAIKNGRSNGNGQMPAQIYTGEDAADVAKFVAKSVGQDTPSGG